MTTEWFYSEDCRSYKKASKPELALYQQDGRFTENSYIWAPGFIRWEKAERLDELTQLVEQSTPPKSLPSIEPASSNWLAKQIATIHQHLTLKQWRTRLWWQIIIPYIVPIVGGIVFEGWKIDVMRSHKSEDFPSSRRVGHHLSDGLFLWGIYLLYLLPGILLIQYFAIAWLDTVFNLLEWSIQYWFAQTSPGPIRDVLTEDATSFIIQTILIALYPVIIWPFYNGGMMRYAFENRREAFIEFGKNFKLVKRYRGTFIRVFFENLFIGIVLWILSLILIPLLNIIGLVAVFSILVPLKTAVTALLQRNAMEKIFPMNSIFPQGGAN